MVVDNLDVVGVTLSPPKTDPPLLVDSDAVLSQAASAQRLEVVAGRNPKILKRLRAIQHEKLRKGGSDQGPIYVMNQLRIRLGYVGWLHLDPVNLLVPALEHQAIPTRRIGALDKLHRPVARNATHLVDRRWNQVQLTRVSSDSSRFQLELHCSDRSRHHDFRWRNWLTPDLIAG